jgi:hypothetical protein
MMNKDERMELLLMDDPHWIAFKKRAESYYDNQGEPPMECFLEMDLEQWLKFKKQLDILRVEQRPAIEKRRKEDRAKAAAEQRKKSKALYMRKYMAQYRKRLKEASA